MAGLGLFCQKDFPLGEHGAGAAQVLDSWLEHTAAVPCAATGCAPWM